jgi:hypothetical protein
MITPMLIAVAFSLIWTLLIVRAVTPRKERNRRAGRLGKWLRVNGGLK